jgi:hypothetical protein
VLIKVSQGDGFVKSIKDIFKRNKHKAEPVQHEKVSKFDNWYHHNLIQDNWYYRAKVLKQTAVIW